MKQRNPVLRVLLSLLITAVLGALYFYITIPAINGHSESFYIFIIVLCVIYLVVSRLLGGGKGKKNGDSAPKQTILEPDGKGGLRVNRASLRRQKNKASAKQLKSVPVLIIALCAAVWIVGTVISAVIFHPKAYYNLLDVQTGDFAQDVAEISYDKIPMLDADSARQLGKRAMGSISQNSNLVSQFEVSDTRTLDQVVGWLLDNGHIPSFCTACYREGRTGDRFMQLLKSKQIVNCCHPNALMTLKEYLEDYASPETKKVGEALIAKELEVITNPKVKERAKQYIEEIHKGDRDFRF